MGALAPVHWLPPQVRRENLLDFWPVVVTALIWPPEGAHGAQMLGGVRVFGGRRERSEGR